MSDGLLKRCVQVGGASRRRGRQARSSVLVAALGLAACVHPRRVPLADASEVARPAPAGLFGGAFAIAGADYVGVSWQDGLAQVYAGSLDSPGGPLVQLSFEASGVPVGPVDNRVITSDGRYAVYQCRPDAICRTALRLPYRTDRVMARPEALYTFSPFATAGSPGRVLFESRFKTGGTHIYEADFGGSAARLVYRDLTLNGWLRDVSPDGRFAIVTEMRSLDDWHLVLVDLEQGTRRRLLPTADEPWKVSAARFSADGLRVYAGTDAGTGQATLVVLDARSGAEMGRFTETVYPWAEIDGLVVSKDGRMVAMTLAAGLTERIRVVDGVLLSAPGSMQLDPPLGQGRVLGFTSDGRVVAEWSTPSMKLDTYLGDIPRRSWSRLESGPALSPLAPAVDAEVIQVTGKGGVGFEAGVLRPRGVSTPRPVVIMLACGPGETATLERSSTIDLLLAQGFAVVLPNVRGSPGYGRAFQALDDGKRRFDSIDDVAAVAEAVKRLPWADPSRLVVAGTSYGGFLALASMVRHPDLWRAGIDLYGIADWKSFFVTTNPGTAEVYRAEVGTPEAHGDLLDALSPLRNASRIKAPILVFHGGKDLQVPVSQSEALVEAVRAHGVRVEAVFVPEEGHGVSRPESVEQLGKALTAFLRAEVEGRHPPP